MRDALRSEDKKVIRAEGEEREDGALRDIGESRAPVAAGRIDRARETKLSAAQEVHRERENRRKDKGYGEHEKREGDRGDRYSRTYGVLVLISGQGGEEYECACDEQRKSICGELARARHISGAVSRCEGESAEEEGSGYRKEVEG